MGIFFSTPDNKYDYTFCHTDYKLDEPKSEEAQKWICKARKLRVYNVYELYCMENKIVKTLMSVLVRSMMSKRLKWNVVGLNFG